MLSKVKLALLLLSSRGVALVPRLLESHLLRITTDTNHLRIPQWPITRSIRPRLPNTNPSFRPQ